MINVIDDFLSLDIYEQTYNKLISNNFNEVPAGDKSFWVQLSDSNFDKIVSDKISEIENRKIKKIFSFFRIATNKIDTDWRIHSDSIINGERPKRALVLYISPSSMNQLHGTAFWRHKEFGDSMKNDISFEDYDKILLEDSNNLEKWDVQSIIGYKVNRMVSYPCNYFHSKFPNVGWPEGRIVYVMFYA